MSETAVLPLSILAATVPTLLYVGLIYWFDRYEKEPLWLLAAAFLWGAVPAILISFVLNTTLSVPLLLVLGDELGTAAAPALIGPPVEETIKSLALVAIFIFWRSEIDSPLDGIIYGAMVGMGFAMVENVYYFVQTFNSGGVEAWGVNIVLRAIVFGLNHALFSSFAGLGIAISRLATEQWVKILPPILGWMTAVFLHFLHNFTVTLGSGFIFLALLFDWGGLLLVLGIIIWSVLQERRWLRQYLAEEVALGTLTVSQFTTASSGRKRVAFLFNALLSHGWRANRHAANFFLQCSHLAYTKHHWKLFQDEPSAQKIATLRQELTVLAPELRK
ncbi:MAG: PrsW family intramembrane metalloprotease [Ardenticatenaceae bacterium]|nr:PrsW family intramembrane metalloprotease [Anaerolineales bacterium]MCB8941130.1 PrsW family intramembrane metalloprotease [Ardenticatenaceae bacterium]MCB8972471.1 PrsW family intramembrane metalloprotease [Ardenticatenaceae bacterium]